MISLVKSTVIEKNTHSLVSNVFVIITQVNPYDPIRIEIFCFYDSQMDARKTSSYRNGKIDLQMRQ